jgi:hypothetical protein
MDPTSPFSVPPDPERPSVLYLPESVAVRDLAAALKMQPYRVVSVLLEQNIFASINQKIPFSAAANVCARCRVTAHKIT